MEGSLESSERSNEKNNRFQPKINKNKNNKGKVIGQLLVH